MRLGFAVWGVFDGLGSKVQGHRLSNLS